MATEQHSGAIESSADTHEQRRVVLGFPMYRSEEFVAEVMDSLVALDYSNISIIACDDCSPDATFQIVSEYAAVDPRIIVEANERRMGMIRNWNRVLSRTYELYPDFAFFAWASDNDLRDPSWVSVLVKTLDDNPEAALAYSRFGTTDDSKRSTSPRWLFESGQIADPRQRLRATSEGMRAGPMMYGLHRRSTLDRVKGVPPVLLSDVLFLSHLSLHGTFVQVPEVLWYRGLRRTGASSRRQRAALFAGRPPLTTFLPASIQHTGWLFWRMVLAGHPPPGFGRGRAALISLGYLLNWWDRLRRRGLAKNKRWRKKQRKLLRKWRMRRKRQLRASLGRAKRRARALRSKRQLTTSLRRVKRRVRKLPLARLAWRVLRRARARNL